MKDFYQFAPVLGKVLRDHLIGEKKVYKKSLWGRFTTILIKIEQMH